MNTFLKILGAIADGLKVFQSLRRDKHHDAVDADPESEWMRQFGAAVSSDKADTKQPDVSEGTRPDGPQQN